MVNRRNVIMWAIVVISSLLLGGCIPPGAERRDVTIIEKTVASYEAEGLYWGKKHWKGDGNQRLEPGKTDQVFIEELVEPNKLDYFWVHSDLKSAFVKGYRLGYQDRTADLVLGPNITAAAARIGELTATKFVEVIEAFEDGWAKTIKKAIDVFITLISEGSQTDREQFIFNFTDIYAKKWDETQKLLKSGAVVEKMSEGGTLLYLDYSKGKTLGALETPAPRSLKAEIYRQAFKVMGDELGRRFSTNLIKRDELIDLLRRSKTALQEIPEDQSSVSIRLQSNLKIIQDAFVKSYGTDAENVFKGLAKDAGYQQ